MKNGFKISLIVVLLNILFISPASAATFELPRNLLNRENIREQIKERMASNPAAVKVLKLRRIALSSGQLSAKNGTTLTIKKDSKTYTVTTDDKTEFHRKFWGKSDISELNIGDNLNIIGTWEDDAQTTIKARLIRDVSIQKRYGVFVGNVTALQSGGFTLDALNRGKETVTVPSAAEITNRKNEHLSFSDIAVGHNVRVRGLWNSATNTITEVTKIKDFSLPARTSE